MEEIIVLVKALATAVSEEEHSDLAQVPAASGEQGHGGTPAAIRKKRRMMLAGPGTPRVTEQKPLKLF